MSRPRLDDAYAYPLATRLLALFALHTRDRRARAEPPRRLRVEASARAISELAISVVSLDARGMSHPEQFQAGITAAAEAYAEDARAIEVELYVPVASAVGCLFAFRDGAWSRDVLDVDVERASAVRVTMTIAVSSRSNEPAAVFLRRTFGGYVARARLALDAVDLDARLSNESDGEPVDASDSNLGAISKTVFVTCARRVGLSDLSWCATCRVEVAPIDAGVDGAAAFVNGSLLAWREASVLFQHLWTLDEKFASFGVRAIRRDLSCEGNSEHVVRFAQPNDSGSQSERFCVRRVTIHFMNITKGTTTEEMVQSAFPLARVVDGERTIVLSSEVPIRVAAELSVAGVFDALRAHKRERPRDFASAQDAAHAASCERILNTVFGILDASTNFETREFLAERAVADAHWRARALRGLQTAKMSENFHELR